MLQNNRSRSRMALLALAGAMGAGLPLSFASPASAQDVKDVAESKVPGQVATTARANYLDGRDVVYRRGGEGRDPYVVNFTTPQNLRMQVRIAEDGRLVDGPELAPKQADNAPKGEERQRLVAEWAARVRNTEQRRVEDQLRGNQPLSVPPGTRVPSIVPGAPGPDGIAAPPARPINTEVRAGELPGDVVRSLDRYTAGARDVVYYKQRVEDRERYQAVFTDRDGARKEVTVHETGSLLSGPLALTDNVTDQMLAADKPDQWQLATGTRVEARDLPPRSAETIGRQVQRASDVRYRRDQYATGNTAYTAHWVDPESGRRYFMTAGEDGTSIVAPRLSAYQPAAGGAGRDAVAGNPGDRNPSDRNPSDRNPADRERMERDRSELDRADRVTRGGPDNVVRWNDVPERVQRTLEPITRKDRDAKYFRQVDDGKTSYGSMYKDHDGHDMWVRVSEAGNTIAGPVSAKSGKGVDHSPDRPREPQPAAGRPVDNMRGDRVNFDTLPKNVQQRVLRETEGGRDFSNMRHEVGGKTYYHTAYTDSRGQKKELWLDDRGEPTAAPRRGN